MRRWLCSAPVPRVTGRGLEPRGERAFALPSALPVDPVRDGAEHLLVHLVVEGDHEAEDAHTRRVDRFLADLPERGVFASVFEGPLEPHEQVELRGAVPTDLPLDSPERAPHVGLTPGSEKHEQRPQRRDQPPMPEGDDDERSPPAGLIMCCCGGRVGTGLGS